MLQATKEFTLSHHSQFQPVVWQLHFRARVEEDGRFSQIAASPGSTDLMYVLVDADGISKLTTCSTSAMPRSLAATYYNTVSR